MSHLADRLLVLERLWETAGVAVGDIYGPALESNEIHSVLGGVGLPAPSEIVEWFSWHNGRGPNPTPQAPLGPTSWTAHSLAEALEERRIRMAEAALIAADSDTTALTTPAYWWEPTW